MQRQEDLVTEFVQGREYIACPGFQYRDKSGHLSYQKIHPSADALSRKREYDRPVDEKQPAWELLTS
jgi:hypothetical protein